MSYEFTRLIYRSRVETVYSHEEPGNFDPSSSPPCEIKIFTTLQQIPATMQSKLFWLPLLHPMRRGLIRGEARVYVATIDDQLAGYAWVQGWDRFRSRYGKAFEDAIMLGPDWVDPQFRGRGLHPLLIRARLAGLDRNKPIVAVFREDNEASISGFKKNGFVFRQRFHVRTFLTLFHFSKCLSKNA